MINKTPLKKGFSLIETIVVIAVVGILVMGMYILYISNKADSEVDTIPTPTVINIPTETSTPLPTLSQTYKEILKENTQSEQGSYWIDLSALPITFDPNVVEPDLSNNGLMQVYPSMADGTGLVWIDIKTDERIALRDSTYVEGGHGGAPYSGEFGTKIFEKDDIDFFVYIPPSDAGPILVGVAPVIVRAIKPLTLSNTTQIYLQYEKIVIEAKNAQLIYFLNNYSKPDDIWGEDRNIIVFSDAEDSDHMNYEDLTELVVTEFFADLNNLTKEQQAVIDTITEVLNAIEPK